MTDKKRKHVDVESDEKYSLVVLENLVKSNKGISVPKTIPVVPTDEVDLWMSFDTRSNRYIPIGIVDSTRAVKSLPVKVVESFVFKPLDSPTNVSESSCSTQARGGTFWFASIKGHIVGTVITTYTCPELPQIEPLIFHTTITETAESALHRQKSKLAKQSDVLDKSKTVSKVVPDAEVDTRYLSRLPASCSLHLKAHGLRLTLSPVLVVALLDDRQGVLAGHLRQDICSPTVKELLRSLGTGEGRRRSKALTDLVDSLVAAFDALFLDVLLYPSERKGYEESGLLASLRDRKLSPSGWFGASHLLRLLVAIVPCFSNGSDSGSEPLVFFEEDDNTGTIPSTTTTAVAIATSAGADESKPLSESTSSAVRVSARHSKQLTESLQSALDSISTELCVAAHKLF
eukprot:gene3709-7373_t